MDYSISVGWVDFSAGAKKCFAQFVVEGADFHNFSVRIRHNVMTSQKEDCIMQT